MSLWSQNVRFAAQKQTSDDGVGMSAKGHKPTFFGDTPTLFFGDTPSTAATHGRLPWGARLAWKLNSKKLLKKIRLEMCLRIILFSFAIVTIIVSAPPAQAEQIGSAEQGLTIARERCGSCHLVVKEDGRSTNEKAPTFARIANTPGMSSAALRSALNTSHSSMPNLIIKDEDADSIIAYILSLRDGQ